MITTIREGNKRRQRDSNPSPPDFQSGVQPSTLHLRLSRGPDSNWTLELTRQLHRHQCFIGLCGESWNRTTVRWLTATCFTTKLNPLMPRVWELNPSFGLTIRRAKPLHYTLVGRVGRNRTSVLMLPRHVSGHQNTTRYKTKNPTVLLQWGYINENTHSSRHNIPTHRLIGCKREGRIMPIIYHECKYRNNI